MSARAPHDDLAVVIERVFDAPASLLFEAYSEARHLVRWYGPRGWPLTSCELEFCPGGRYRFAMTGPGGEQAPPFGGRYLEIVPHQKIVYTCEDDGGHEIMIVTITFDERGDGSTLLTIHTLFDSVETKDAILGRGYQPGVESGLDQLADLIRQEHLS